MSLTVAVSGYSQTIIKNKKGKIVGLITEKGDTLHAIPIVESRILHEFAERKVYLDSMINVREQLIKNLEYRLIKMERGYENLLVNAGDTQEGLLTQLQNAKDELVDFKKELRSLKMKLFWANFRTVVVAVVGAVIVWLVAK